MADDTFGKVFTHDLRSVGVHFESPFSTDGMPTGRCLVVVTPDAERSMCTHLGAANQLGPELIDEAIVAGAAVTYLEGYLWDQPQAKDAIRRAASSRTAPTGASPSRCPIRSASSATAPNSTTLVESDIDILFANEDEITGLYQVDTFDEALHHVRGHCEIAALTRGPHGSVIVNGDDVHVIDAHPVAHVADTTGAGDMYAAGFLYGFTRGLPLGTCGRLASLAAAEVISHLGARPEQPLAELARPLLEG